ncbi:MAG: hypothetical protein LBI10_13150, partial [Deltaproteobacteria bacterium]|nr:hypothetical protein [Deltaproteobacteria bacterium]
MEHRQKNWGGLPLVSVSLALALVAILSLGGGMAMALTINIANSTSTDNVTISSGVGTEGNTTSSVSDLDSGFINATGNISILNSTLSNVSNITAGENILLDANGDGTRDTFGI